MSDNTTRDFRETYLKTKQAAELLQVSYKTLESWRRTQLQGPPYCKIGRTVRYRLSDLEAYMEEILVHPTNVSDIKDLIRLPERRRNST